MKCHDIEMLGEGCQVSFFILLDYYGNAGIPDSSQSEYDLGRVDPVSYT